MEATTTTPPPSATASAAPVAAKQTLNPKLIVPFVNSVRSVFSTMVGVQTTVGRPYFKHQSPAPSYDVSSIVGFSGEVVGSVVVSFQTEAAVKLVEAFAGVLLEPKGPDFADAIGELANMIAGSAKKDLGAVAAITVPNVIIGPGHTVALPSDVPCVVIPCTTPVGNFAVEVCIKSVAKPAA